MPALARRARSLRLRARKSRPARASSWLPPLEVPHAGQAQVIGERSVFNVLAMGRRWGKTRLGVRLAVEPMMQGYPVAWLVPELDKASDIWQELCEKLKHITTYKNESRWELKINTGGSFKVFPIDRRPNGPRSKKFRRVICDEAAFCRYLEKCLEEAVMPTMADDPDSDLWLLSSPQGKNAFYKFWLRGQPGQDARPGWKSWRMPTKTNPHLSVKRIEQLREEVSPRRARQEYDADFEGAGTFFDDWQEYRLYLDGRRVDWHVCNSFDIPSYWPARAGLDFGKNVFYLGLHRFDEWGGCYMVAELVIENELPSAQAPLVVKFLEDNGLNPRAVPIYADPSGFPAENPEKRKGQYPVEEFWKLGLNVMKADNKRHSTNENVLEWLRVGLRDSDAKAQAGRLDGIEEGKAYPRFRVFRGKCPYLTRTVGAMIPLEDDPRDFDSDGEDHGVDGGLRYGLPPFRSPLRARRLAPAVDHLARRRGRVPGAKTGNFV